MITGHADVPCEDRFSEWEFDFPSRNAADTTETLRAEIEKFWIGDLSKVAFMRAMEGWSQTIPKGFFEGIHRSLFRHDGYYYVVDLKSNFINGASSGFTADGIVAEMVEHGCFFQ